MFDVIVIGGGPGGYLAAERAGQAGLKTLLIEKNKLGGVCLNEGCIPSKALLNSAKLFDYAKGGSKAYGVSSENAVIDHNAVITRKDGVVSALIRGVEMQVKGSGVTIVNGEGCISRRDDEGFKVIAGNETYTGKNLIIATGASASIPPIDRVKSSLDTGFCITSKEALGLKELPKELAIIGGGVIGLEFASYFVSAGCKVTVIEALSRIGGNMDAEIMGQLMRVYGKCGVTFHLNATVTSIGSNAVVFIKDGQQLEAACDKVLLAVGRRTNTEGLGLESINVQTGRNGIETDSSMRTNIPGVYAVGDCTGKTMLAHCAYRGAEVAVNNILGHADSMDGNCIPSVIYTHPEAASAGLKEEEAAAGDVPYRVVKLPIAYSGRAMAESNDTSGLCKLVINKNDNTLMGVQLLAPYASEIILSCVMMIDEKMPLDRIKKFIFPHPTVGEIIREGLFH